MLLATPLLLILKKVNVTKIYFASILGIGLATVGYGLSNLVYMSVIFNFIGGIANTSYMVSFKTTLQSYSSDENRGRIFAIYITLSQIVAGIVLAATGLLADAVGVGLVIAIAGGLTLIIGGIGYKVYKISFIQETLLNV